jgi:KamA family protein
MEPTTRYRAITLANVERLPQWQGLDDDLRRSIRVVGSVLPFRTNSYVADHLIDWDAVPDDPMFQLTFPQRGMLDPEHFDQIAALIDQKADKVTVEAAANRVRRTLNPHPADQMTHNVPSLDGVPLPGVQHKYRETVLFFPNRGQTCHAYCTFCFRWAQFVGPKELRFAASETDDLVEYLHRHPDVTDVLFTGGDPMIMKTQVFRRYLEPLLEVDTLTTIRIGTKAPAYWPQRFVEDDDADALLRLYEQVVASGRHLAVMGHYSHPVELSTKVGREAVRRIRSTGAAVRMQSPLIRHVNDDPEVWASLWRRGVRLGAIPYYMFVERDTGARRYFEIPLVQCWRTFRNAYRKVSGLARTVRGPSMSAAPGKIRIAGVTTTPEGKAFILEYLQARDPDLVGRPFYARYDATATWFDQLRPLRPVDEPFFPKHVPAKRRLIPIEVTPPQDHRPPVGPHDAPHHEQRKRVAPPRH